MLEEREKKRELRTAKQKRRKEKVEKNAKRYRLEKIKRKRGTNLPYYRKIEKKTLTKIKKREKRVKEDR